MSRVSGDKTRQVFISMSATTFFRKQQLYCTKNKLGDRAFSVAGPVVWNSIPESISSVDNVHTFKRLLKTHFFTQLN